MSRSERRYRTEIAVKQQMRIKPASAWPTSSSSRAGYASATRWIAGRPRYDLCSSDRIRLRGLASLTIQERRRLDTLAMGLAAVSPHEVGDEPESSTDQPGL